MNNKAKFLTSAAVLAAALSGIQSASAHLEPKADDGMEKCYGVVKAGKNDCASKAGKHGCAAMGKIDSNPNEWVKVPEGLCDKLVGGSVTAASKMEKKADSDDGHGDHDH